MEDQLHFKSNEFDSINNILDDTKSQLFLIIAQLKESDSLKCIEQQKVQELEDQKNHLMSEFSKLKSEIVIMEKKLRKKKDQREDEIISLKTQIRSMEEKMAEVLKKYESFFYN